MAWHGPRGDCGCCDECGCVLTASLFRPQQGDPASDDHCVVEAKVTLTDTCTDTLLDLTSNCIYVKITDSYFGTVRDGPAADVLPWKGLAVSGRTYTIEAWQDQPCPGTDCADFPNDTNNRVTDTFPLDTDDVEDCDSCPDTCVNVGPSVTSTVQMSGFRTAWSHVYPTNYSALPNPPAQPCDPFTPPLGEFEYDYTGFGALNFSHATTEVVYNANPNCPSGVYCPDFYLTPSVLYLGDVTISVQWIQLLADTSCGTSPVNSITLSLYSIFGPLQVDGSNNPIPATVTDSGCGPANAEALNMHRVLFKVSNRNYSTEVLNGVNSGCPCKTFPTGVGNPGRRNLGECLLEPLNFIPGMTDWGIAASKDPAQFTDTFEIKPPCDPAYKSQSPYDRWLFGRNGSQIDFQYYSHCDQSWCDFYPETGAGTGDCTTDCHPSYQDARYVVPDILFPDCTNNTKYEWTRS